MLQKVRCLDQEVKCESTREQTKMKYVNVALICRDGAWQWSAHQRPQDLQFFTIW